MEFAIPVLLCPSSKAFYIFFLLPLEKTLYVLILMLVLTQRGLVCYARVSPGRAAWFNRVQPLHRPDFTLHYNGGFALSIYLFTNVQRSKL